MKIFSDRFLLDSNVLLYTQDPNSPYHQQAVRVVEKAGNGELKACLAHQNILEFYAVATNKKRFLKTLTPKDAKKFIEDLINTKIQFIFPNNQSFKMLYSFLRENIILGGDIFDVYLAATMLSNGIKNIITVNAHDFMRFPQITVMELKDTNYQTTA